MQETDKWKRMAVTAFGTFVLGIGIGLCDHALLGTDPFTVLLDGLVRHIPVTLGLMNVAVSLLMIAFGFAVDRSMISPVSFAAMISSSLGIDLILVVFPKEVSSLAGQALFFGSGEILYALGTAIAILPEAGYDPYDAFLISLQKLSGQEYRVVRWGTEIAFLLIGGLLGGLIGIGTVLTLILTGPMVEWFLKRLRNRFPGFSR